MMKVTAITTSRTVKPKPVAGSDVTAAVVPRLRRHLLPRPPLPVPLGSMQH